MIVGWGSTKGAIEEAVTKACKEGMKVSSLHLKFLQPMASGIKEILKKFKKVTTVEINFSDDKKYEGTRQRPGVDYTLPYWMGRYFGYFKEG